MPASANTWLDTHPDVTRSRPSVDPGSVYRDRHGGLWTVSVVGVHCRSQQDLAVLRGAGGVCVICPLNDLTGTEFTAVTVVAVSPRPVGHVSESAHA